jgi:hypothetical protein
MTEGEVVEQLVEYMSIVIAGIALIFSVVSAYIVALNYFVGDAMFVARVGAFAFVGMILALLMVVMLGAEQTHAGLIARLFELEAAGQITAAGRGVLDNAREGIDGLTRNLLWGGMISLYAVLAYMTFLHRWKPDVVNVALLKKAPE